MRKAVHSAFLISFLVVCAIAVPAMGAIINVGGAAGLPTIRAGINQALDGDTVLVADGTYSGPGNTDLDFAGKRVSLRSENGPANCIIDGGGTARAFIIKTKETRRTQIIGFTIQNCDGDVAGGFGGDGGAFIIDEGSPTIARCIITGNSASSGGAMRVRRSNALIADCLFTSNTATRRAGAVMLSPPARPTFSNCTFTNNTAPDRFGGAMFAEVLLGVGVNATVINCILWGDTAPEIMGVAAGGVTRVKVRFSDIAQAVAGAGNIHENPLFVGPTDFHLQATSPCIDKGNNASAGKFADLDGNRRNADGDGDGRVKVDMGAFEVQ